MDAGDRSLHELMRSLGLSRSYAGYKYLVCALELLREEPERILRQEEIHRELLGKASDSSTRAGCYILRVG